MPTASICPDKVRTSGALTTVETDVAPVIVNGSLKVMVPVQERKDLASDVVVLEDIVVVPLKLICFKLLVLSEGLNPASITR